MAESVSVVVMAFNEEASLEPVTLELLEVLVRSGREYELLIVDDGSTDRTGAIADELAAKHPGVRVHHQAVNGGLGGVYRTGYAQARCDLLTFFPADGQFPATILEQFLPQMHRYDMLLGYVEPRERPLVARTLSLVERVLYTALFGFIPRFQGIMLFRRSLLDEIPLKSTGRGWAVVMELLVRVARAGKRVGSQPTELRPRKAGHSKVNNLRTIYSNTRQLFELRAKL